MGLGGPGRPADGEMDRFSGKVGQGIRLTVQRIGCIFLGAPKGMAFGGFQEHGCRGGGERRGTSFGWGGGEGRAGLPGDAAQGREPRGNSDQHGPPAPR